MTGPVEIEGQEPTSSRLRFNFTCTADRKPEEVCRLLWEIGRGVRLSPFVDVFKVWGQTPDDYTHAYKVAGVCAYDQAPSIVRALAEADVWTSVFFDRIVARGNRGSGLSRIVERYQVSITPELKASYQV